ncbi:cytochrome P450 2C55-like [Mercenaria mercenaria]|uniref:cytochrome P450 2C55-like n=1 Tax=Mercenaria mercenaria TaxID=6596 RepID=UPI00234F9E2E|nr:cytochrome P450 2C55-like [Mercenaria mercenaria]
MLLRSVIWQSGNDWKVLRKFVLQTLREFGVGKTSLEQKFISEVDAAYDVLYATNGKPSDMRLLTSMTISNVIYGIVFTPRVKMTFFWCSREFGVGKTSLEQKIMSEVDAAYDVLYATNGKLSDMRLLTSMMISNVIYGIVFAKRFDYKDEKLHEIIENLDKIFQGGGVLSLEGVLPKFLLKLFNKEAYKSMQNRLRTLTWIKEHIYGEIGDHESTFDNDNIRDFIDLYLQAKIQHSDESIFNSKY